MLSLALLITFGAIIGMFNPAASLIFTFAAEKQTTFCAQIPKVPTPPLSHFRRFPFINNNQAQAPLPALASAGCWRNTPCSGPSSPAFPGPWDKNNYSPFDRLVSPYRILSKSGEFISNFGNEATLKGDGSQLIFDFEKLVGGIATITYSATGSGSLGLAFSEASNFTGLNSDSSNGNFHTDGAVMISIPSATSEANYTMPLAKLRGGFRYITIFAQTSSNSSFTILDVKVEIAFQPDWPNLRAYKGYFSSSDELLNKIWYAGAYTLQTNAIAPSTGRELLGSGWMNDVDLSLGTSGHVVYVDGSKRDRTVWPGDLGIAVPSILVSTGDWVGVRNTLDVLYADQASSGELPFAAPGLNIYGSDTYHMATLLGTYDYFLWTNDLGWLSTTYPKHFKPAMNFITAKIDSSDMLFVTGNNDWGRLKQGGRNTEANMLMYKILTGGAQIAGWAGDSAQAKIWAGQAAKLKDAVNKNIWDSAAGAYKDTDTDGSIHPQDGNSLALLFSVAPTSQQTSISTALTKNWIGIGSLAPELPNNLVGFGQSFEVKGHLAAHQSTRALDLIRRAWGWYLNSPYGTASTCVEGYLSDGSFGYRSTTGYNNDASYTSHAHGWSTGPTDALTSYIVGLTITQPGGSEWSLEPQFGDLSHAEAGFTTTKGQFAASWSLNGNSGFSLKFGAPSGTKGSVYLQLNSAGFKSVQVDGKDVDWKAGMNETLGTVMILSSGGSHELVAQY